MICTGTCYVTFYSDIFPFSKSILRKNSEVVNITDCSDCKAAQPQDIEHALAEVYVLLISPECLSFHECV